MSIEPVRHDRESASRYATDAAAALGRMSDGDLLNAWTEDAHRDALAILVQRYSRMVLSVCRRRCRTESDVDDAYQSTFLYLAHHGHKIRSAERLPGWLHRVAQRTATATLRLNNPETTLMVEPTDSPCEPFQRIAQQHDAIVLDEELANLPESYRSVIVMRISEDCSLERLAEHFQTSIGSIRGRLHRGKKLLAKRLRRRGVVPAIAFAAAMGSMATVSQASAAGASMLAITASPTIPTPTIEATSLKSLFSSGTQSMTAFKTVSGLLAVGTIAAVLISVPASNAGETITIAASPSTPSIAEKSPVVAQVGAVAPGFNTNAGGQTATVFKTVPRKPTTELAKKIQSMMGVEAQLEVSGTLDDAVAALQKQLGVPVLIDSRGVKFAEQTMASKVSYATNSEPVQTSLRRILSPLGLKAVVEDEGLVVTADPAVLVHQGIGDSRWVNVNNERVKKITEALQTEITIEHVDTPLNESIAFISSQIDTPIQINRRALEEIGQADDEVISAKFSKLPARDVLAAILLELELTYTFNRNQLTITTIEAAEADLLTRFYWLEGLGVNDDYDSLMQLIQMTITPDTWEALGGPSTMSPYPGNRPSLVVSTTCTVHEQIEKMLKTMRENSFGPDLTTERTKIPIKDALGR